MRVAIIGSRGVASSYSGIERVLARVCPRIAALGHEIDVFGEDETAEVAPGVRSVRVPALGGKYTETLSRSALATATALARGYDVVNYVAIGPGILSALPRLARRPVVVSVHGLDWNRAKWPLPARAALRGAERAIGAFATEITVVSRELARYFEETHGRKAVYTPNGVDIREGEADAAALADMGLRAGDYVLFASRLVPEKGGHELVEAFSRVTTDKKLVVAGGGRYDHDYVARLRTADPDGRCVFTGHLTGERLDAVFKGAYLYVLPSHMEGLSLSLLEAMGYGKAVLVSDIAENREVVGEAGLTFPVGDVGALAACLGRLMADPGAVAAMSARGRERARQLYSWDAVARTYADLYETLGQRSRGLRVPGRTGPAPRRSACGSR